MKILFFTDSHEDYVPDSLLHGLKRLFGSQVVDYPRKDILYKKDDLSKNHKLWGRGFTLYTGLLEDDGADRYDIGQKLEDNFYDLVLIGSIHRQDHFFKKIPVIPAQAKHFDYRRGRRRRAHLGNRPKTVRPQGTPIL